MKNPLSASDIAAFREHARKWGGVVHTSPPANAVRLARDDIEALADSHDLLTADRAALVARLERAEGLLNDVLDHWPTERAQILGSEALYQRIRAALAPPTPSGGG